MDYEKIGFKCGIEMHGQLNTKKLFCSCESVLRDDKPTIEITRKMRAVAGESGEIDAAAKNEMLRDRTFIYEGYDDTCLVEFDEEPPHDMNKEALYVAVQVANMLNMEVVDEIQVMRKTVVDGSNTSGFQRTSLVAMDGLIDGVKVDSLCLEEDSARPILREGTTVRYRVDRLGIPLVEIATAPDIKSGEHCKEICAKIGMFLKSTGKARRGLGTIRQDINVSIKGGARVEIKGAQDLDLIPTLVDNEIIRQQALLEIKNKLSKSQLEKNNVPFVNITKFLKDTKSKVLRKSLDNGGEIIGVSLPGFKGLIGKEVQPGRRLGTEFSDRAKVIAHVGGLFHSDELPNYGITEDEVKIIKKHLGESFLLIADIKEKAILGLQSAYQRARECFIGIPSEVREAKPDGNTKYMRPMPGADRMYPETDVKPIKVDFSVSDVELISDKINRYVKDYNLGKDLATKLVKSEKFVFEKIMKLDLKSTFVAETLVSYEPELRRKYKLNPEFITDAQLVEVFTALSSGKIAKDSVLDVLVDIAKNHLLDLSKFELMSDDEVKKKIKEIVKGRENVPFNGLIGLCMKELKGKADGKKIVTILKEVVGGK